MNIKDKATLELLTRICATAIANQAILKCSLAGVPLSVDSVLAFVGDFFDPKNESLNGVMAQIEDSIAAVLQPATEIKKIPRTANQN